MRKLLSRFATDQSGATAIEYGLIAAGIGVAVITLVGQIGDEVRTMFTALRDQLVTFNGAAQ
jgi:pilus assembly protein Flp/PilA